MVRFPDRPINQKLVIITLVTTTIALGLAGFGNVLADSLLFRRYLRRDLTVLARVIADHSTAALAFDDPKAAAETLAALKERSHVIGACVYRNQTHGTAELFAQYNPANGVPCPQLLGQPYGMDLILTEPILLNARPIGTLVLIYDLGELDDRILLYGSIVFGVFALSTVIAFLVSGRLRKSIATPIAQLVRAATAVSETGNYGVRADKLSGDELGILVDHFNDMLAGIESAFGEVEKERARFHFMAESMPQKIFTTTPNGDVNYLNPQWMEFTGLSFDEIKAWGWTQLLHPDDVAGNIQVWTRSLASGEPYQFQQRFRRADGKYRWHLSRALPMRDAGGNITMWIGSNTDIHEQKEKEEELRRANEDLQQFAYSASHDLKEPIRNVTIYSEIVVRRYHEALDDEGRQFLGFLMEGGRRLSTLVDDLLAYTRASMADLSEHQVDASNVLKESLATLAESIRENAASITADELPSVYMSDVHLQQVFQNLIGNALKYRADQSPRIHISARQLGEMWCFSVKDNGIGVDPQYKEKIFGVFKRLSHDRKYSGTGIGLAICQRVVERYGGRIWVESEGGNGATFFFTLPLHAQLIPSAAAQSSGS